MLKYAKTIHTAQFYFKNANERNRDVSHPVYKRCLVVNYNV